MGYWSANKSRNESFKEWATKKYTWEDEQIKHTVLDAALVNFHELYVACERISKANGVKYTYCMVVKLVKDSYGELMSKEMDESMGPYYHNCPKRILALLSPVRKLRLMGSSHANAKEWRKANKAIHDKLDMLYSLPKNTRIQCDKPISVGGQKLDTFYIVDMKKRIFGSSAFWNGVRLDKWCLLSREWRVV